MMTLSRFSGKVSDCRGTQYQSMISRIISYGRYIDESTERRSATRGTDMTISDEREKQSVRWHCWFMYV